MKKRILATLMVAMLLIQIVAMASFASAAGAAPDTVTLTLDTSANKVLIEAVGFAPNQMVSILGYYNVDTGFENPDYIGQATADAAGALSYTYISAAQWKGGDKIIVKLNGSAFETGIVSDKLLKITSATPLIVEKYAANLVVQVESSVVGDVFVDLYLGDSLTATAPVVGGIAKFKVASAPVAGTICSYIARTGELTDYAELEIAALPSGIWSIRPVNSQGNLSVIFGAAFTLKDGAAVTVGSASASGANLSIVAPVTLNTNIPVASIASGASVVVSGVKFAELFPSYTFTFTAKYIPA